AAPPEALPSPPDSTSAVRLGALTGLAAEPGDGGAAIVYSVLVTQASKYAGSFSAQRVGSGEHNTLPLGDSLATCIQTKHLPALTADVRSLSPRANKSFSR